MNIINVPDPASLLLATLPPRPLPAAPGAPVVPATIPPVPNAPVVVPASAIAPIVSVDPLAALLQITDDQPDVPVPTADLARRYAESGTLSQQSAKNVVQSQAAPVALGAADAKLLNGLAQAYRQDATATPLPQPPNVAREITNAALPNAPGTAGNAPAVIVVDGKTLTLNPAQTAAIRDALATSGTLDPRALANILRAPQTAEAALRAQPASALREMAAAQVTQPASVAPQQSQPQVPVRPAQPLPSPLATLMPRQPSPAPLLPQTQPQQNAQPLPVPQPPPRDALAAAAAALQSQAPAQIRGQANSAQPAAPLQPALPTLPAAIAAAIVIDGRAISLNPAQVAVIRANLGLALRLPAGPLAGTDAENPLAAPSTQRVADAGESARVQIIDGSVRAAIEEEDRRERPQPKDIESMLTQAKPNEKVEAVRAVRQDHIVPYEPQLLSPQPRQDQLVLAPAPDHVILQGRAPDEAAQPAITGLVIAVAPGLSRDDVTAEYHQGAYRISFAGSTDHIMLHTGAGLSAQLVFADGTSLRLQLDHD